MSLSYIETERLVSNACKAVENHGKDIKAGLDNLATATREQWDVEENDKDEEEDIRTEFLRGLVAYMRHMTEKTDRSFLEIVSTSIRKIDAFLDDTKGE